MDKSKALASVQSLIRGTLEKEHGSPTILRIFQSQIDQSLNNLRMEFRRVRDQGEAVIWPKMVTGFIPNDQESEEVSPVWGPVKDEEGNILGLKVISKTQGGVPRKPRVHLIWAAPDPL